MQIASGTNVTSTTLSTSGTGVITIDRPTLTDVTKTGALVANNNAVVTLAATFTNNGTFDLNSTGSGDDLALSGPVTLAGTGVINFNGVGDGLFANTSGDRLTIGAGQTLAGAGNIGFGQNTFTNNGLVTANQSGNTLVLQAGGGNGNDFTNAGAGLARAENGGILQLASGTFTGNSFQALTGSQLQINSGVNVISTTLSTSGTGVITIDRPTLTDVTKTGALVANNNAVVTLAGTFTNNGTFDLNSTGSGDDLALSGPVTLAGTGVINFNGVGDGLFANASGDRLIIGAGQTITGAGNIGFGQTTFTNNGLVTANQNGQILTLQPGGGTADFTSAGAGLARAENGGILQLSGGTFTGGSFQALDGSQMQIASGTNITSTTLSTSGTGVITIDRPTFTDVTKTGALVANNNAVVTLAGTFTNNGTFDLNSTGSGDDLALSGPVTLAGTGVINFNGVGDRLFANTFGDRLIIGAGQTITGAGNIGVGQTTFTNNGLVTANQSGNTLTIQPGGGTGDFTNSATGTLEASNGGILTFVGGGTATNNGTFRAITTTADSSTLTVPSGALTNVSGTTLAGGSYIASASGGGTATIDLTGANITTNAATVVLSGANSSFAAINNLADNQGSFTVAAGRNFATAAGLTNSGTVHAGLGSALAVNGNYTEAASGTLAGAGTIIANTLAVAGTVAPGDSGPGTLAVIGSFTLESTARLAYELGSLAGPNDLINLTGNLVLDGQLDITALTGFGSGIYDLINYTGSLTDNGLVLGSAPAGFTYDIVTTVPGQVDLVVTSVVPEPSTWMLMLGGLGLLCATRRTFRRPAGTCLE